MYYKYRHKIDKFNSFYWIFLKSGGQEVRKSGSQEVRKSGGQEVRRNEGLRV
jgi:hypothetical protein